MWKKTHKITKYKQQTLFLDAQRVVLKEVLANAEVAVAGNEVALRNAEKRVTRPAIYQSVRKKIYDRDGGICQVCFMPTPWDNYECGHTVDYMFCKSLEPETMVLMCRECNRLKPMHETMEEYKAWAILGGKLQVIKEGIVKFKERWPKKWEAISPDLNHLSDDEKIGQVCSEMRGLTWDPKFD